MSFDLQIQLLANKALKRLNEQKTEQELNERAEVFKIVDDYMTYGILPEKPEEK